MKIVTVDAFTDQPFAGNPAAICRLDGERDAKWMQRLAAEMNLSETAFVRPLNDGYELRWFTPAIEVELCGHATLACAHVLWTEEEIDDRRPIRFHTKSGVLTAARNGDLIELDFPATPPVDVEPPAALLEALNIHPLYVGRSKFDKFVVVESEEVVHNLQPDFAKLAEVPMRGVMVTAMTSDARYDFISRYFAPAAGVNEDPVTGSAHCVLGPYWAERLGKNPLTGYQASSRGGVVHVRIDGDRVILGGHAVTVLRGEIA